MRSFLGPAVKSHGDRLQLTSPRASPACREGEKTYYEVSSFMAGFVYAPR